MITPLFECSQDTDTVTLTIRAPHSRPKDIDISVDGCDLHFHCAPYFLHLRFPHELSLSQRTSASYDMDTGLAKIPLDKKQPGLHFERLDMLSTLIVSRASARMQRNLVNGQVIADSPSAEIEVVDANPSASASGSAAAASSSSSGHTTVLALSAPRYGFGARYSGVFAARAEDISEILELPDPDTTPPHARHELREERERMKFSAEHYAADFMLRAEFAHVLKYEANAQIESVSLSNEDKDVLLKLPGREYLPEVHRIAAAELAGILYASCYDLRATMGERSVESAWTIARLAASFSFLEVFDTPRDSVFASFRRTLVYPLYRHFELASLVLTDLQALLTAPDCDVLRARVLRALLAIRRIFENDRIIRVFVDIYLTDYCVWIQSVPDTVLTNLASEVAKLRFQKKNIDFPLAEIEREAMAFGPAPTPSPPPPPRHNQTQANGDDTSEVVIRGMDTRPGFELTATRTRRLPNQHPSNANGDSSSLSWSSEGETNQIDEEQVARQFAGLSVTDASASKVHR